MFSGPLLALALVSFVDSCESELSESLVRLHLFGDLLRLFSELLFGLREHVLSGVLLFGLGGLELFGGGVSDESLLGLVGLPGEQDQLILVGGKSLDIKLESFFRSVLSSVIDDNTDGSCELRGESRFLDLLEGESSAISQFRIVLLRASMDDGSEFLKGSWECSCCLFLSVNGSSMFASWLIEPCLHKSFTVLSQMNIWKDVVVLYHLLAININNT